MNRSSLGFGLALGLFALAGSAPAITRTETIVRAKAFSFHPWTAGAANATASCNSAYQSIYTPGDYMGLPYDWGGYMSLFTFDQQIAQGYGAGSYPADGVLDCTAGLDCSGFVSQAWSTGHYTTSNLATISSSISQASMLAGDIFNKAGYHTALFSHTLASGEPVLYESVNYNVHLSMPGWSWVNGYTPLSYKNITGTSAATPDGTPDNPVPIGSFPYVDSRNTTSSASDLLDGCALDPSVKETGPEYVYELTLSQPGQLTVSVQDDVGVDIDVHLYTSMNTSDCIARNDSTFTKSVDCGTYYVVADTFAGSNGALPGPYTLTVDFKPTAGQGCGAGPKSYAPKGGPGTPCAYPGDQSLPFCNPNLGADTCLYGTSSSFCSMPCQGAGDCGSLGAGSCCASIGSGENYCMPASQCGSAPPDSGVTPPPDAGGDPADAGFGGAAGSSASSGGAAGTATGSGGFGLVGSGAEGGAAASAGFGASAGASAAPGNPAASSGSSSGCSVRQAGSSSGSWLVACGLGLALGLGRRRAR